MSTETELYLVTYRGRAYIAAFEKGDLGRPSVRLYTGEDGKAPTRRVVEKAIVKERKSK